LTGGAGKGDGKAGQKELEQLQKRADAIAASVNPLFAFNQQMAILNEMLAKAVISDVNYALAVEQANKALNARGDAIRASVDPGFVYAQQLK
jgi:hypothetical protein